MRTFFMVLAFLWPLLLGAQSYTVESVPNQKLIDNSYVSNPDGILSKNAVGQIDAQLRWLEDSTTSKVAVVMLHSIGEADIFSFAEELFNTWGIGQADNDNGLLILYVEDQQTIRFHTGDGMEAILPDALCKQIQLTHMVPRFKEGNVDQGMIDGISATVNIITDPTFADEVQGTGADDETDYIAFVILFFIGYGMIFFTAFSIKYGFKKFADLKDRSKATYPEQSLTKKKWLIVYGAVPLLIIILYGFLDDADGIRFSSITLYLYFIGTLFFRLARLQKVINKLIAAREYFKVTEVLKKGQVYWFFIGLVFPVPFFPYFFFHLYRKKYYRNHPRNCKLCNAAMKKLNEKADDDHLTESKIMEEKLKAVDYDVWKCQSCEATEEWAYKNTWSRYEKCPKCKTSAFYTKASRTLKSATYSATGLGERTQSCKFCQHTAVTKYSIPMKTRSSSSSSSSSGSSGGSWGGGSSSGGGASSSW